MPESWWHDSRKMYARHDGRIVVTVQTYYFYDKFYDITNNQKFVRDRQNAEPAKFFRISYVISVHYKAICV